MCCSHHNALFPPLLAYHWLVLLACHYPALSDRLRQQAAHVASAIVANAAAVGGPGTRGVAPHQVLRLVLQGGPHRHKAVSISAVQARAVVLLLHARLDACLVWVGRPVTMVNQAKESQARGEHGQMQACTEYRRGRFSSHNNNNNMDGR